jgi:hypothetical protein
VTSLILNGKDKGASPITADQPTEPPLDMQLTAVRQELAQQMMVGLQLDQSHMTPPNIMYGQTHDAVVIDSLIELLVGTGLVTKDDVTRMVLAKMREKVAFVIAHNETLRHRIVIAKPGQG